MPFILNVAKTHIIHVMKQHQLKGSVGRQRTARYLGGPLCNRGSTRQSMHNNSFASGHQIYLYDMCKSCKMDHKMQICSASYLAYSLQNTCILHWLGFYINEYCLHFYHPTWQKNSTSSTGNEKRMMNKNHTWGYLRQAHFLTSM